MLLECAVTFIVIATAYYYHWRYQYWQRKKVPFFPPKIPWGNISNPLNRREHRGIRMKNFYQKAKDQGWKHVGLFFYTTPIYLVTDVELLKSILTKDFQYFTDRGFYYNEKHDPLSAHLFAIGGLKWRQLRTKLTPTFTSGKMRLMFGTLLECQKTLLDLMAQGTDSIDIKEILGRFTTDIIGSCAFGLDCQAIQQESPFRIYGKKVFQATIGRIVRGNFALSFPKFSQDIGLRAFPKDVTDFFFNIIKTTVNYRNVERIERKDFLQLLINLKQQEENELTIEEIAAQCFVFFIAGFETSSTAMTFALYELARNQQLQDQVREEIRGILQKHPGNFTYDDLKEMKLLGRVIDESLRKYPPLPVITRKCVQDYQLPHDGVTIEKGTRVIIPILGIHHDPEYYPDPDRFDPDRFADGIKPNYTYMPFGEGPRLCIGLRFGLMQSKVGLATLLSKYRFTVNERTLQPLRMAVNSFVLAAEGEIFLNAEKL